MSKIFIDYGNEIMLAVAYIAAMVFMFVKNYFNKKTAAVKAEASANAEADNKAAQIDIVKQAVNQYIKDAEQMKNYTGTERKAFVMTRAIQIAGGLLTNDELDKYIEEQVALTKVVNTTK